MQVGDDQRAFVGPVERAGEIGDERGAEDAEAALSLSP